MSTAMVMAGWSVHLTTLFLGKLEQAVNKFMYILSLVTDSNPSCLIQRKVGEYFYMINLHESMGPGQDQNRAPGFAVSLASVARHVTNCATRPGKKDRFSITPFILLTE